jgi:hypothetical protein
VAVEVAAEVRPHHQGRAHHKNLSNRKRSAVRRTRRAVRLDLDHQELVKLVSVMALERKHQRDLKTR